MKDKVLNAIVMWILIGILFCSFIFWLYLVSTGKPHIPKSNYNSLPVIMDTNKVDTLSINNVRCLLIDLEVKYHEIGLAQSILETGWFKSEACRENNNLFGFRTKKGYILYDSWQNSVRGYKSWQVKYYQNDREDYYAFLKRIRYAEDSTYIPKLKQLVTQLRNEKYN